MTTSPSWSRVDDDTGSLLDLINADWRPFVEEDRNTVARAIRDDAAANGGVVSQNRVRKVIAGMVKPQRVGPVYRALCLFGELVVDGYEESDDLAGRNSGKPARRYRWVGELS